VGGHLTFQEELLSVIFTHENRTEQKSELSQSRGIIATAIVYTIN
jgi:hypothetical protein